MARLGNIIVSEEDRALSGEMKGIQTMGKHDPTRDGDVHPDTSKHLDPKDFEKSGQDPTGDNDNDDN